MAAAWQRAWRSRVSSTKQGAGAGDWLLPTCHPDQQPSRSDLVEGRSSYTYNFGSSYTSGSGTTTTLSNSNTTTGPGTPSDPVGETAVARRVLHPFIFLPAPAVVEEKVAEEELDQGRGKFLEEERVKTREHIKALVRGGASGLDRWLSELRVGWVLHPAELVEASPRSINVSQRFQYRAEAWILAVYVISRSISSFNGWCCPQEEETAWPPASEFVRFVEAALLKMFPFVDTVATLSIIDPTCTEHHAGGAVPPADKFQALVDMRDALSRVSEGVQLWVSWLHSSPDAEAAHTLSSILFPEVGKLDDAIWDTRRRVESRIMSLTELGARAHQRSPDIHKVTRSIISYINVLSTSYGGPANSSTSQTSLHAAHPKNMSPLTNLIMEMVQSLEERMARKSLSFHDHSLKFLFLIDNSYFMWQQFHTNRLLDVPMTALTLQIDDYINSYLHVSWTPVLKCLQHNDRTPCCFTAYSPFHRFESQFHKTYRAQKLWKIPAPELRKRLRKAIIEKVISGITKFLEDNSISTPDEVNPEKLEEMLEELFEG